MAPYFLFFGREPYLSPLVTQRDKEARDAKVSKTAMQLKQKLTDMITEANRRADEKREKEAKTYNRKVKHEPLEPGDQA